MISGLPRVNPFWLKSGTAALLQAYGAMNKALDKPIDGMRIYVR